ncbi:MAG TPA: PAS domain S-box protein [Roseiarcus sp.]|jgi:PAS domain S-box-containing protein
MAAPGLAAAASPAEFAAIASDAALWDLLPCAAYTCNANGAILRYNKKAADIWGREPELGDPAEGYCGSYRPCAPDGRLLSRQDGPVAQAIRDGQSSRDVEVVFEQPSGRLIHAKMNIDPIRDDRGKIIGAINCFQDVTARKQAERRLERRESLLQAVVETTPECITIVARDGSLLHVNHAGLGMIEADDFGDVEGSPASQFIAPEHRAHWSALHEKVCKGDRLTWEFDLVGLRGGRRRMETHAAPLRLPDGSVAALAITHDITTRRQGEEAVRESESRLRELLEALPNAIYTTDAQGLVTFYNQAAIEMFGRRPELGSDEWLRSWKLYRTDGSFLPYDESSMALSLQEKRPIRGEEAIGERPDGSRVHFVPYPTPLVDARGKLVGAVNMLVDLSDRKKAEDYAQRLAAIVEFSDDAIVSKNTHGVIQTWNKGAARLFGYAAEEAIGQPVSMLIPPERQDEEPAILERIRLGERIDHYETVRIRKDGTLVDISLTVSPLKDASGKVVGASKIARDITERRRQEERRQLLVNELNHRVKNTLATVQSIASQAFRNEGHDTNFSQFERRLVALSTAHDVLTRENWEGADLKELVTRTLSPLCPQAERVDASGPWIRVRPKLALSLSMALHELATNAAKYGSLSNQQGRIKIEWRMFETESEGRFGLRWEEMGGPPVEAPKRKGFGSRLLERALSSELDATVRLAFPPTGVVYEIEAPFRG